MEQMLAVLGALILQATQDIYRVQIPEMIHVTTTQPRYRLAFNLILKQKQQLLVLEKQLVLLQPMLE
jgi:hypothetical protein